MYEATKCQRLKFTCLCSELYQVYLRTGPNANNKNMKTSKTPLRPSHGNATQ